MGRIARRTFLGVVYQKDNPHGALLFSPGAP
ncbi:hypothetical protein QFZ98_003321 [Paraburkholderia youngii]